METKKNNLLLDFLQRQKRSTLLILAILLFLLAGWGGLKLYQRHLATAPIDTPIPPPPDIEGLVKGDSILKTEEYAQELRNGDVDLVALLEDHERMERMTMSWTGVYPESVVDTPKAKSPTPVEAKPTIKKPTPQPRKRSNTTRYGRSKSRKVTTKQAKEPEKPHFNLKVQEATTNRQHASTEQEALSESLQFARAMVAGNYKVRSGETVSIQLLEPTLIQGVKVPELSLLAGRLSVGSNRVYIKIEHVNVEGNVFPVNWECYDQDLMRGLPYEGRIKSPDQEVNDRLSRSAERDLRRRLSPHPYISDVAEGLIEATKSIRRNKRGKVSLPNNYAVFLKIQRQ